MALKTTKIGNFESLEAKKLMTADMLGMAPVEAAGQAEVRTVHEDDAAAVAEIDFVEVAGDTSDDQPVCYLKYKLDRAFIKSWSTSGDADDAEPTPAAIFVRIPGVSGDVDTAEYDHSDYFVADSFSFGVEREMKESGEKGGTTDMNIGIGELQECTISKSMDSASMDLAQLAISGNSCKTAEIDFVEVGGGDTADRNDGGTYFVADSFSFGVEREMKESGEKGGTTDMNIGIGELQEATHDDVVDEIMQSWSVSGDADDRPTEEVAFYYNKIAFGYAPTEDGIVF